MKPQTGCIGLKHSFWARGGRRRCSSQNFVHRLFEIGGKSPRCLFYAHRSISDFTGRITAKDDVIVQVRLATRKVGEKNGSETDRARFPALYRVRRKTGSDGRRHKPGLRQRLAQQIRIPGLNQHAIRKNAHNFSANGTSPFNAAAANLLFQFNAWNFLLHRCCIPWRGMIRLRPRGKRHHHHHSHYYSNGIHGLKHVLDSTAIRSVSEMVPCSIFIAARIDSIGSGSSMNSDQRTA